MDCHAAVELLTAYLEGALAGRPRRRFEAHLSRCRACRSYLEQMRVTIAVLGRLEPDRLPTGVRAELVSIHRAFHGR